jgi:cobalt-zinc-cadmium efflux system outer membrane protein
MSTLSLSAFRTPTGTRMLVLTLAALVATSGCAGPAQRAPEGQAPTAASGGPPPPPPMAVAAAHPRDWSSPVTMERLIQAAQDAHPTRDAIAAAQAAAAAQVRQAGAWDNPELELSLGRTRPRVDDLERDQPYGGSLSQRLNWWGKRNARIAAARAHQQVAEAEGQIALAGLRADVRRAAIIYAVAVEAVTQAVEDARIATELAAMTEARLAVGEADRSSVARAKLEATTAALHRDARTREAATALAVLRTWCDPALPEGLVVADAFAGTATVTDATSLALAADRHPQLRALAEAAAAAGATVNAEREARMPDLTVGVFADREAEKDSYGVTLGFELPLWNRNDAGIAAAEAAQAQARAAARGERLRLARDLAEALGAAQTAQGEVKALTEQAVPVAEEAIQLRTSAFQAGEASLSDLLEARRAANTVRAELRDARRRAALALVDLGMAVGDPSLGAAPADTPQP